MPSARDLAAERGLTLIKPFDEPQVIAGQGTVGLEIAEQAAEEGVTQADVLVCCGGGGLTSGIALALAGPRTGDARADRWSLRASTTWPARWRLGRSCRNAATTGSLCDAIVTPQPGAITFPILQRLCGPGLVVTRRRGAARDGAGLLAPADRAGTGRGRRAGRGAVPPGRDRRARR